MNWRDTACRNAYQPTNLRTQLGCSSPLHSVPTIASSSTTAKTRGKRHTRLNLFINPVSHPAPHLCERRVGLDCQEVRLSPRPHHCIRTSTRRPLATLPRRATRDQRSTLRSSTPCRSITKHHSSPQCDQRDKKGESTPHRFCVSTGNKQQHTHSFENATSSLFFAASAHQLDELQLDPSSPATRELCLQHCMRTSTWRPRRHRQDVPQGPTVKESNRCRRMRKQKSMLEWKTDVDCRLRGHNRMRLTRSHCGEKEEPLFFSWGGFVRQTAKQECWLRCTGICPCRGIKHRRKGPCGIELGAKHAMRLWGWLFEDGTQKGAARAL